MQCGEFYDVFFVLITDGTIFWFDNIYMLCKKD